MSPRVLVRPNDLADAQAIAEEIVGELDIEPAPAEERTLPGDPHRPRPREDDDDALASLWEDDDQADEPSPPKPKQLALPVLVAFLGLAFGLSHFYVGRNRLGGLIAVTAVVGLYLFVAGNPLGGWLYALAWCADLFGGCIGVAQYNRRIGGPRALPQGITRTGLPS